MLNNHPNHNFTKYNQLNQAEDQLGFVNSDNTNHKERERDIYWQACRLVYVY